MAMALFLNSVVVVGGDIGGGDQLHDSILVAVADFVALFSLSFVLNQGEMNLCCHTI